MAKKTNIYIASDIASERYTEAAVGADGTDLAVLGAAVLLCSQVDGLDISVLEDLGKFDEADIRASVKYWKGAGVFVSAPSTVHIGETAHKEGAVTHTSVEKYTNDELADVLTSRVSEAFVDEAQKALGKMFNNGEVGKLVGIVDQLGFEEEAVLAILSYCVRIGKKSLSYAEKIAISFHDEDILGAEAVHAQIDYLERKNTATEKVRALFGFGGRALSATEKKLFGTWTVDYGFDMEVITYAYDLTVDAIQVPAPKYTDKILTKWYQAGLKTLSEIKSFASEEKKKVPAFKSVDSKGKDAAKNAEIEDWFEKRLQNSFK